MDVNKVRGMVIGVRQSGDADKFVTVLTRNKGKLTFYAKGAFKPKGKLTAATELFTCAEFVYSSAKGLNVLQGADITESFYELREDIESLAYAGYFSELADSFTAYKVNDEVILVLLYLCIKELLRKVYKYKHIRAVYETGLLRFSGYISDFSSCDVCGNATEYIGMEGGYCKEHKQVQSIFVNKPVLKAIKYICESPVKNILSFSLDEKYLDELCAVNDEFIKDIIPYKLKSRKFLKDICND